MRRILSAAGAALLLIGMTGCVEPDPGERHRSSPRATPVFASDEEALAAAEAAYAAYLEVSDLIFSEGGLRPERLEAVAQGDFLDASISGFENVQSKGWRSTGRSAIHSIQLQSVDVTSSGLELVTVYLCDDVSEVNVLDASGVSVVSPERPDRTLFEVTFDLGSEDQLLVSRHEVWGDGQC